MEYYATDTPITVNGKTLISVVRICHQSYITTDGYTFTANKVPVAIIIDETQGLQAWALTTEEIPIDWIAKKIQDLQQA